MGREDLGNGYTCCDLYALARRRVATRARVAHRITGGNVRAIVQWWERMDEEEREILRLAAAPTCTCGASPEEAERWLQRPSQE